jgi:isoamylase
LWWVARSAGENNNDGEEHNLSWNCGLPNEEGDAALPATVDLRTRQVRNHFVALMVAQVTPMILMGDEYGHSKGGNNNTYCHDNALTYFK